jgi:hypothetical protein
LQRGLWRNAGMDKHTPTIEPGKRYFVRTDFASTGVRSLAYDARAKTLVVEYPSGEHYRYFDVPPGEFQALFTAKSIGARVNTHVKPRYRFEKA